MSASLLRRSPPAELNAGDQPDDPLARRRVAVGDDLTLVFENRATLRFRLQELARVARLTSAAHVRRQFDWYEHLLPSAGELRAAVWIGAAGRRATLDRRAAAAGGSIAFGDAGGYAIAGHFRTDRVRDRLIGLAGWVEFAFTPDDLVAFATPGRGWHLVVAATDGTVSRSEVLGDGVWQSLLAGVA